MRCLTFFFLVLVFPLALAEDSKNPQPEEVVAPPGAKECKMPPTPPDIPEGAGKPELIEAQKEVRRFQTGMKEYRSCLNDVRNSVENTEEHKLALDILHDKSVNLEEKVANRFNDAVQSWKSNTKN